MMWKKKGIEKERKRERRWDSKTWELNISDLIDW